MISKIATNRETDIESPFLYELQSFQYGLSIMNWIPFFLLLKNVLLVQYSIYQIEEVSLGKEDKVKFKL